MKLEDYKIVLAAVGLIGVLLFAAPTISIFVHLPAGEQFSELYVLNSDHTAGNYPFSLAEGQSSTVYVGVTNNMGSSEYYVLFVKFRNETDLLPNSTLGAPSPLGPLYEYRVFVQDNQTWENPLTFSVSGTSASATQSSIKTLTINNVAFDVNKLANWNVNATGFYYQLFLELWRYNPQSNSVQYDNRFVGLYLNLTASTQT